MAWNGRSTLSLIEGTILECETVALLYYLGSTHTAVEQSP